MPFVLIKRAAAAPTATLGMYRCHWYWSVPGTNERPGHCPSSRRFLSGLRAFRFFLARFFFLFCCTGFFDGFLQPSRNVACISGVVGQNSKLTCVQRAPRDLTVKPFLVKLPSIFFGPVGPPGPSKWSNFVRRSPPSRQNSRFFCRLRRALIPFVHSVPFLSHLTSRGGQPSRARSRVSGVAQGSLERSGSLSPTRTRPTEC